MRYIRILTLYHRIRSYLRFIHEEAKVQKSSHLSQHGISGLLKLYLEVNCINLFKKAEDQKFCAIYEILRCIRTILRFTNKETPVQKQALPFVWDCYGRPLTLYSKWIAFYSEGGQDFKKRSGVSQYSKSELLKQYYSTKGTLCAFGQFFVSFS